MRSTSRSIEWSSACPERRSDACSSEDRGSDSRGTDLSDLLKREVIWRFIQCPECDHAVSTYARACPQCGYPLAGTPHHRRAVYVVERTGRTWKLFRVLGWLVMGLEQSSCLGPGQADARVEKRSDPGSDSQAPGACGSARQGPGGTTDNHGRRVTFGRLRRARCNPSVGRPSAGRSAGHSSRPGGPWSRPRSRPVPAGFVSADCGRRDRAARPCRASRGHSSSGPAFRPLRGGISHPAASGCFSAIRGLALFENCSSPSSAWGNSWTMGPCRRTRSQKPSRWVRCDRERDRAHRPPYSPCAAHTRGTAPTSLERSASVARRSMRGCGRLVSPCVRGKRPTLCGFVRHKPEQLNKLPPPPLANSWRGKGVWW